MSSTGGSWLRPLYLKTYPTRLRSQWVSDDRDEPSCARHGFADLV